MKQPTVQAAKTNRLRLLFGLVIAGVILYVILDVIAQLLPPHYNPLSQPESDLAVGPYGFLMAINFVIRGLLSLIFLLAFARVIPKEGQSRNGLILLGVWAIGALILAFVPTDLTSPPHTIHGAIHALVALVAFLCGALGELLLSRSLRRDRNVRPSQRFLAGLAVVTLVCVVIVIVTVVVSTQIGVWGLLERIFIGLVLLWMLVVSIGLWQRPSIDLKSGLSLPASENTR